jgi:hypothetical protein
VQEPKNIKGRSALFLAERTSQGGLGGVLTVTRFVCPPALPCPAARMALTRRGGAGRTYEKGKQLLPTLEPLLE